MRQLKYPVISIQKEQVKTLEKYGYIYVKVEGVKHRLTFGEDTSLKKKKLIDQISKLQKELAAVSPAKPVKRRRSRRKPCGLCEGRLYKNLWLHNHIKHEGAKSNLPQLNGVEATVNA